MAGNVSRLSNPKHVEHYNEYDVDLVMDGSLKVRYWVMKVKDDSDKEAGVESYIDSYLERKKSKNIVHITLNGQRQGTLDNEFIKQRTRLSFLTRYLIVQVECDNLSSSMKRKLFSSTRDRLKTGAMRSQRIEDAVELALKADGRLLDLEWARKEAQISGADQKTEEQVRKLLDRYITANQNAGKGQQEPAAKPRRKHEHADPPSPFVSKDPPTLLQIANAKDPISIPQGRSGNLYLVSDAPDGFLNRDRDSGQLTTELCDSEGVEVIGHSDFTRGRMTITMRALATGRIGPAGCVMVTISNGYMSPLQVSRKLAIVEPPKPKKGGDTTSRLPNYELIVVEPNDAAWVAREWDDQVVGEYVVSPDSSGREKLYFFISMGYHQYVKDVSRKRTEQSVAHFKAKYLAMVAYHLWQYWRNEMLMRNKADDGTAESVPTDMLQDELRRVANTLLLSMQAESELEQIGV